MHNNMFRIKVKIKMVKTHLEKVTVKLIKNIGYGAWHSFIVIFNLYLGVKHSRFYGRLILITVAAAAVALKNDMSTELA